MTVVYIISFLLIAFGIVRILGLTPESIGADVAAILDRKKSLRDNAMRARGKKRTNKLVLWLDKIRRALSDTGKEKSFGVACAVALLLMILGCVGAIVIGNPFLAPVLAIALAMIPFLYLLRTVEQYEEQVKLELETGLSAITSSYERTMNLKSAVEENIDNLKPPVKGLFQSFLVEISVINPDVKAAICHLRERVKDWVWEEWCDTLISCQDDSQLIGTLCPVVEKLTDMRIVNAELKVMISENKREYYIMALMVVANIPLLYFLNKEWYGALMYTTFGKVTLAICGAVMLITFLRMQKYCKPVEYRRKGGRMIVLQIIIGVIAAVGVGFLLADLMKIPSLKASKAANSVGRKGKKKTGVIELYRRDFATKLAGKLHLNEFKRANLVIDLRTANMEITPEQYMADAIVKALMVGILAIPAFFISVFFGFLILGIALFVYFSESKKVTRKIRQKRANIEYELPRLVGHIEKLLTHSRDIIYILESYIPIARPELKEELFITVAEMRSSGNIRNALDSLDKRIGSAWLSEVVRALETVENSADTTALWTSLSMKFKELQRLNLKAQANTVPRKVKKLSMALMMCFLLIYIAVIGQVLMNSLGGIM